MIYFRQITVGEELAIYVYSNKIPVIGNYKNA